MAAQDRVREPLDAFAVPGANAAELLCDRHPAAGIALSVIAADLNFIDVTYGELREKSARFAAALSTLGVRRGDHVATLMGQSADLVVALLGIWRLGAVAVPLSTASAHDAIASQLQAAGARLALCDAALRRTLLPAGEIPNDASPLVVVAGGEAFGYDVSYAEMVDGRGQFAGDAGHDAGPVAVGGDGTVMQIFGANSPARGVTISLGFVGLLAANDEFGLAARPGDTLWRVPDPESRRGPYLKLLAPLASGTRLLMLSGRTTPGLIWAVLEKFHVTHFAAPAGLYAAMAAASTEASGHSLTRVSSSGAALVPDMIAWGLDTFGLEIRANDGLAVDGRADRPAAMTKNHE